MQNDTGVTARELSSTLADVQRLVRNPEKGRRSIRVLAQYCRVSDRTVRRWLDGTDQPPSTAVQRLQSWIRQF